MAMINWGEWWWYTSKPSVKNRETSFFRHILAFATHICQFVSRIQRVTLGRKHGVLATLQGQEVPWRKTMASWWFGTFLILPNSWDDDPIWRTHIFQRSTANQMENPLRHVPNPGLLGPSIDLRSSRGSYKKMDAGTTGTTGTRGPRGELPWDIGYPLVN